MNDLSEIIPLLLAKTSIDKLQWEELSSGSYVARLGDVSVEISSPRDTWRLILRNEAGTVLESVDYKSLESPRDGELALLYDVVRRKALGVDEALASLRAKLERL